MAKRNSDRPADRRLLVRIGVNNGDVAIEDCDIHGDGVNLAARMEALAGPGGDYVSGIASYADPATMHGSPISFHRTARFEVSICSSNANRPLSISVGDGGQPRM